MCLSLQVATRARLRCLPVVLQMTRRMGCGAWGCANPVAALVFPAAVGTTLISQFSELIRNLLINSQSTPLFNSSLWIFKISIISNIS